MICDGAFGYSAHHHHIVVLPNNHDSFTGFRRLTGKNKGYSFNGQHSTEVGYYLTLE